MAVLLVVTGFIIATVLPRIISGTKKDMMIESKRIVRTAREEVLGWYIASSPHKLPNSTQFNDSIGHRIGRRKSPLTYHYSKKFDLNATLPDKENPDPGPIAFWVVSPGENHAFEDPKKYNAQNITISYYDNGGFDDIVDFVTKEYLYSLGNGTDDSCTSFCAGQVPDDCTSEDFKLTSKERTIDAGNCINGTVVVTGSAVLTVDGTLIGTITVTGNGKIIVNGYSGKITQTGSGSVEVGDGGCLCE